MMKMKKMSCMNDTVLQAIKKKTKRKTNRNGAAAIMAENCNLQQKYSKKIINYLFMAGFFFFFHLFIFIVLLLQSHSRSRSKNKHTH